MCLLICWFKEWPNNIIRETIPNLQDDHMALSFAIVSKGRVSNEYDVAIIWNYNLLFCI